MLAVKEQAKQGVPVQSIELEPLGVPEVAEFVADTLHQDAATAMPLAEVIQQKTGGNPFFMRQFLQALYGAQLITFDAGDEALPLRRRRRQERRDHGERRRVARHQAAAVARQRRARRCASRPSSAADSSCALLANVQQQSAAATDESLRPAIEAGLIAPLSGLESVDSDALAVAARLRPVRVPSRPRAAGRLRDAARERAARACTSRSAARGSRWLRRPSSRPGCSTSSGT